jgi:hypothetical protein
MNTTKKRKTVANGLILPNAEVFENNVHTERDDQIDFIRVCQLEKGMKFLLNSTWFVVHSISEDKIFYFYKSETGDRKRYKENSIGAKSQQFVQVIKSVVT